MAASIPDMDASTDALERARAAIAEAHARDPERRNGQPGEALYAEAVLAWVRRLVPTPGAALELAARCQHLERWVIARADYPQDKPGYLRWRRAVQARQARCARELLTMAGCTGELAERVAVLVGKLAPHDDAGAQALEDAACLVFLEHELARFAAAHGDYPREKFIDILRKTAAKMSPRARSLTATLPLPPPLAALLDEAVGSGSA